MTHYHVGHNMPGYIPEEDPFTVRTLRSAISASRADALAALEYDRDFFYSSLSRAERKEEDWHAPLMRGRKGDYWADDGSGRETHYWVSDACECAEGEHELAEEE